jgi:hypothetical protein
MYKLIYLARRNPTVSREDWPETWRSHATFANQFAFVANDISYSCYCNRIDHPALDGQPIDLGCLSSKHDGVALGVSKTVETLQGGGFSPEERALIDQDELRVFDMLTPNFSFYCAETVLIDGKFGEYGIFQFLARKPGLSREAFAARLEEYTPTAKRAVEDLGTATRYAHNHPIHDPLPLFPFDAISDCWFAKEEDAMRGLLLPGFREKLAEFCDLDRSLTMITHAFRRRDQD